MATNTKTWTLAQLADVLGGSVLGDGNQEVRRPAPADSDDPFGLAFAGDESYLATAIASGIGAVIIPESIQEFSKPAIRHKSPRAAFGKFLEMNVRGLPINNGVHAAAIVDPNATVDPSAQVGPYAVIEAGAVVGPNARVYSFAYLGENCSIGARTTLYPHSVVLQDVSIGEDCIIAPGAVVGFDGFGFVWTGESQYKVPQVGRVEIGNKVEIGANTTVDRATSGVTEIHDGVKLDNLVQIAHNCNIGKHSIIASFCGMSGSTILGERVTIAGQVGFKGHLKVASDVILAGRSAVTNDITEPGAYGGFPLQPIGKSLRTLAASTNIVELTKRVRSLELALANLQPATTDGTD